MADEATQTSAAAADPVPAEASVVATPQTDPTPSQADSKTFTANISAEIDDLWAQAEGRAPKTLMDEPAPPEPAPSEPEPVVAEAPKQETPKAEAPTPADDPAEVRRQAYEQAKADYEAAERVKAEAEQRVRQEVEHKQAYEAYIGPDAEYQAVNTALRQYLAGNYAALDAIDVTLPNGQKVSEVKGTPGLTQEEAANLLTAWDTARRFEDVMGDRKVARLIGFWNDRMLGVLADPDVVRAEVIQHKDPAEQVKTVIEQVRAAVTKRLSEQHATETKAKDAEIAKLTERVNSLVNERGNLTAQQRAASAASPDRPGQPGNLRRDLPSPEELAAMPFDQAFKNGDVDRVLRALDGGLRRAG